MPCGTDVFSGFAWRCSWAPTGCNIGQRGRTFYIPLPSRQMVCPRCPVRREFLDFAMIPAGRPHHPNSPGSERKRALREALLPFSTFDFRTFDLRLFPCHAGQMFSQVSRGVAPGHLRVAKRQMPGETPDRRSLTNGTGFRRFSTNSGDCHNTAFRPMRSTSQVKSSMRRPWVSPQQGSKRLCRDPPVRCTGLVGSAPLVLGIARG